MLSKVSRREFVIGAGMAGGASAMQTFSAAARRGDTPVMRNFREFKRIRDWFENPAFVTTEEADDLVYVKLRELEAAMMRAPSQTTTDLAAKMLIESNFGDYTCRDFDTYPAWAEVRELVEISA